jgi:NADPH:quinone reductase-like Zn-dependent oxidoreductase
MNTLTAPPSSSSSPAQVAARTMQAVVRHQYGPASALQVAQVAVPAITDEQMLIEVKAAGLDRGAWHLMTGRPYLLRIAGYGLRRPRTPGLGRELAGVVQAVGSQVQGFQPGDRVYGIAEGAFAEYAAARPGQLAHLPEQIAFTDGAAVPISAMTALQALRNHGRLRSGQRVLIIGASGGVGSFAVQLARTLGAHVTGVCSAAKVDLVRSLGADEVIDYTQGDFTRSPQRYDLVLDIGGNRRVSQLRRLLTASGTLVFVGGEGGDRWTGGMGRQLGAALLSVFSAQRLVTFICRETSADLTTLAGLLEEGRLRPMIDRTCPLSGVPEAMRDLEAGRVRGKVVVVPAP